MAIGIPKGDKTTVMLRTAPMIINTNPSRIAINRPVKLMIQARKRQIAQNGHKYQGTGLAFVI
jgi:hypothetical protein